jgi:hypothetical protein
LYNFPSFKSSALFSFSLRPAASALSPRKKAGEGRQQLIQAVFAKTQLPAKLPQLTKYERGEETASASTIKKLFHNSLFSAILFRDKTTPKMWQNHNWPSVNQCAAQS